MFGADTSGLAAAHRRMCDRCGLESSVIETGLVIYSAAGDSLVARCDRCGYAADLDFARSKASDPPPDPEGSLAKEEFFTPGLKTIAAIAGFTGLPQTSQMKSLVMLADAAPVLAMLRGDHQLSEKKLRAALGAKDLRPAQAREIVQWFGAGAGSLGPVGVENMRVVADLALHGRRNMITGANRDDYHLKNVTPDYDFHPEYFDLRQAAPSDGCARCPGTLKIERAIEIAHASTNAYRIDLDRLLSIAAELHCDKDGLRLSPAIAPFATVITPVNYAEPTQRAAADRIYGECLRAGLDALLDDREERPGVKFKDADLIGIPYRITIGKKLSEGLVELVDRRTRAVEE
ncbi:MAG: YbaK/EbsC family protein, partial [Bryobacteraceae bacterium]